MAKLINLIGNRYGHLVVVQKAGRDRNNYQLWLCKCDCGQEKITAGKTLKEGRSVTCGCRMMKKLIGEQIQSLIIQEEVKKNGTYFYKCICQICGIMKILSRGYLLSKKQKYLCKCNNDKLHGLTKSITYSSWVSMKKRCLLKTHEAFNRYGGSGIKICDEWIRSFQTFHSDMGDRPSKAHSLDRIDNSKGYYKENCRWATRGQQGNNRKTNKVIEVNGERKTLSEWSQKLGGNRHLVQQRLLKGWSIEKSITTPARNKRN